MSTMQNIDNIEMMAARRATNRAKREAVGTGLTSVDEVEVNERYASESEDDETAKERVKQLLNRVPLERIDAMFTAFSQLNVPRETILKKLNVNSPAEITGDHMEELTQLYREINTGNLAVEQVFGEQKAEVSKTVSEQTNELVSLVNAVKSAKTEIELDRIITRISDLYASDYITAEQARSLTSTVEGKRLSLREGK
jgi:nicotinamide mononucleotide adenylyltransferase